MTGSLFGYTGALYTSQAGAAPWNMRNRQYHPGLGRFLQTDPISYAGGINLYAYVGGDPVNAVDPWGVQEVDPVEVVGSRRRDWVRGEFEAALRRLQAILERGGRERDERLCQFYNGSIGRRMRHSLRERARQLSEGTAFGGPQYLDGVLYGQATVAGTYVFGASTFAGVGIEINDGIPGRTYLYIGRSIDVGLNIDFAGGIYYSTSSNLGNFRTISASLLISGLMTQTADADAWSASSGLESGAGFVAQFDEAVEIRCEE